MDSIEDLIGHSFEITHEQRQANNKAYYEREMACFDKLPKTLRDFLNECTIAYEPSRALSFYNRIKNEFEALMSIQQDIESFKNSREYNRKIKLG